MEAIEGASFSLHTAKTWKKNKGKRLVRSIAKKNRAGDRRDNATVALYMVDEEDKGEEEEEARKKLKEEKEKREDANRRWRERKEREQSGTAEPKAKKKVDKETRNRMMDKELRCRNCRDNLDAEIWECENGHGFCGDCVDKANLGKEEDELEMGADGIFRNKGLDSLRRIVDNEESEDTLWLCTRDDDEDSVTLTEKTKDNDEEEDTIWRFRKMVGTTVDSTEASVDLVPKTMSEVELKDTGVDGEEQIKEKYEASLQKNIKTMDFFDTSTLTNKTQIGTYGDYNSNNRNVFESYNIDDDEWNKAYKISQHQSKHRDNDSTFSSSSSSSSSNYSTDTELEIQPVTKCPVCKLNIKKRNLEIEKVAVLFNKMMAHRMKI